MGKRCGRGPALASPATHADGAGTWGRSLASVLGGPREPILAVRVSCELLLPIGDAGGNRRIGGGVRTGVGVLN